MQQGPSKQVNVVWMERVVVRENGVAVDVPHAFNPETGTYAMRMGGEEQDVFEAGRELGFWQGQQLLPQETVDRLKIQLPWPPGVDVNQGEQLEEDGGLFGGG